MLANQWSRCYVTEIEWMPSTNHESIDYYQEHPRYSLGIILAFSSVINGPWFVLDTYSIPVVYQWLRHSLHTYYIEKLLLLLYSLETYYKG